VGSCSEEVFNTIYRSAVGNALIATIGTVPGYWFTVAFVDRWGRLPIQYMGFAMMTALLVILAAAYPQLGDPITATAKPSE
jgi:PHS family inorganic phosphate transporter-like MFS transporter